MRLSLIIFISFFLADFSIAEECSKLMIKNGEQIKAVYNIELANTKQQRRTGLMYRKNMPENAGMLFTWQIADRRAMWMKNTFIPLDMLFIKGDKILGILENIPPHSLQPRYIEPLVDKILEINAGQSAKNKIKAGDVVECVAE